MIVLLATLGLACEPTMSDTLDILVDDGATDVSPLARIGLLLGDVQSGDPELLVEVTDEVGDAVPVNVTTSVQIDDIEGRAELRLLEPEDPLVPGASYTVFVDAPRIEQSDTVTFHVGDDEEPELPRAPRVEIRRQQDVFTDEDNMCASDHRVLDITVDTQGQADAMTLVHVWPSYEGEPVPSLDDSGPIVQKSNGNARTLRTTVGVRDEASCVTAVTEDILGQRSEPTTVCFDGVGETVQPDERGCACSASTPSALLGALGPLLLVLLVRRRQTR